MTISNELLDELLKGCKRPDDLLSEAGLMKKLKIRLMERMLGAELTAHLSYEAGAEPPICPSMFISNGQRRLLRIADRASSFYDLRALEIR